MSCRARACKVPSKIRLELKVRINFPASKEKELGWSKKSRERENLALLQLGPGEKLRMKKKSEEGTRKIASSRGLEI
jgi:hypothetical protein